MTAEPPTASRRGPSPITWRIVGVNVAAMVILVVGLMFLGEYRRNLIAAELTVLRTHAELFAAALAEGAVVQAGLNEYRIYPAMARQMVRNMVRSTSNRARLFGPDGDLVADSRLLLGNGGPIQIERLPPPVEERGLPERALELYDRAARWLPGLGALDPYEERVEQRAADYKEVMNALHGEADAAVRRGRLSHAVLSVAVPIQRYKQVLGALLVTSDSRRVDEALFQVRLDILKIFGLTLAVTVLLSLYLAGSIARPLRRLAAAADQVRQTSGRHQAIPDLGRRGDEIGDLSLALREMTEALWLRMDAIERFAADVSHEIKNPLTSLRSAVETAARISDPEQQKKLMGIILDDVQRLNRLISDISDASRLDAELSRAEFTPVDLGNMLRALCDVYGATAEDGGPRVVLEQAGDDVPPVRGIDGRLVQVFRNLIGNAITFSPPGGTIAVRLSRGPGVAEVTVEDDGPGIPAGKEEAIFARFYTERPAGEKFGTHSGLGLSISRQIVEAHGGTLSAENRRAPEGGIRGARFRVRLPAGE